jgi:hypothetical protein
VPLTVEPLREAPAPAPLAVYVGDQQLATISAQDHADVAAILDTGLALTVTLDLTTVRPTLVISQPLRDAA